MAPTTEKPDHLTVVETSPVGLKNRFDLLDRLQKEFISQTSDLFQMVFAQAEDALINGAQHAGSNTKEVAYFEASQELAKQQLTIATEFMYQIADKFGLDVNERVAKNTLDFTPNSEELTIVDKDEQELDLAITRMTTNARNWFKDELYDLTLRMDVLYPDSKVTEDNNPLDPKCLATSFTNLIERHFDAPLECGLIVLKAFEKGLLKDLKPFYIEANKMLVEAGILPTIKRKYEKSLSKEGPARRRPNQQSPGSSEYGFGPDEGESIPFIMPVSSLGNLMSQFRQSVTGGNVAGQAGGGAGGSGGGSGHAGGSTNSGGGAISIHRGASGAGANGAQADEGDINNTPQVNFYVYTANPGPQLTSADLQQHLTSVQHSIAVNMPLNAPSNVVPITVSQALAKADPEKPNSLSQNNEDIINLVSIFFDKILEDKTLPTEIKSLICRLQIPILKVAIKDPKFLTNSLHPARQLVNDIVRHGARVDTSKPLEKDAIYNKLLEVIDHIALKYQDDDSVFSSIKGDLEDTVSKEERRASAIEKRTHLTEEGKARLAIAKTDAKANVYAALNDADIAPPVSEFLTTTWLKALVITHLKQGKNSDAWKSVAKVAQETVSVAEKHAGSILKNLTTKAVNELIVKVEAGLRVAIHDPEELQEALDEFKKALDTSQPITLDFKLTSGSTTERFKPRVENEESMTTLRKDKREKATALERQKAEHDNLKSTYLSLAQTMPIGTWLSYRTENQDKYITCKLSKKIDDQLYLFVNRLGFKVDVVSQKQFAMDLQSRSARIMETAPFFDRVMKRAVEQMQTMVV